MKIQLSQLRMWLVDCGCPKHIISKAFNDAALEGPAPYKIKRIVYLSLQHHSNVDDKSLVTNICKKINNSNSFKRTILKIQL